MKRNRLNRSSRQATLFSETASRSKRYRQFLTLSALTLTGFFITNMVLATSEQSADIQSEVIALPGSETPASLQTLALTKTETLSLQTVSYTPAETTTENSNSDIEINDHILSEFEDIEKVALEAEANENIELDWQHITVKSGDNLSLIFPRVGLTARDVYQVAKLDKTIAPLLNLKPGQTLRFGLQADENNSLVLNQLQLVLSPVKTFQVTRVDDQYEAEMLEREAELREQHVTGIIDNSLFETGLTLGLSDKIIMELAYVFGWDIDFALDLRKGDHFKLIYNEHYLDGDKIKDGEITAAEFTNQGKTFRAIRYTDPTGLSRFYSPKGDSMRKAFSRTPVHFSRISSRFNPNRKHPVLKTNRPHRGVDYAAATGTPILATGDGKVDFLGTKGGYGRTIILSHGGKYTTLYAHMSRYKKGLKRGKRVKQGDTIGYIGSSGLATGPHLHYEFRVNGAHRNPLTVELPKAEPLPKKYQTAFFAQAKPILAQLDSLAQTAIASNE